MKAKWFLLLSALTLTSCDQRKPVLSSPEAPERKLPSPTRIENPPHTTTVYEDKKPAPRESPPDIAAEEPVPPPPIAPPPESTELPVARSVEGKPGFVYSPFNDKVIDVRDLTPGTLVADPTYPASEKKFFRVPQ